MIRYVYYTAFTSCTIISYFVYETGAGESKLER